MPAPTVVTYSNQAKIDAQTSFRDLVDAGTGAGKIRLRDEADTLLAEIPLNDPSGTIDASGVLTITASGPDSSADATGTCSYGEILDSDNNVCCSMPAVEGPVPVSGYLVLNNTSIIAGQSVDLASCVIGG